jgi:CHAT domain-containing protein/Tfp pilus assembly protein PilF
MAAGHSFDRHLAACVISIVLFQMFPTRSPALGAVGQDRSKESRDSARPVALRPNGPLDRTIQDGESHVYEIQIDSGLFLHAVVKQLGIHLTLVLYDPDGEQISSMDTLDDGYGLEEVSAIVAKSGKYKLEVTSSAKAARTGHYRVTVDGFRGPDDEDRARITAERIFAEAEMLRKQGTAPSNLSAIQKYLESLPSWRAAGDKYDEALSLRTISALYSASGERIKAHEFDIQALSLEAAAGDDAERATTLAGLGSFSDRLGERQKAIGYYGQALSLRLKIGDRSGQLDALYGIALAYAHSDQKQKALDYYNQALQLVRKMGNRAAEAVTLTKIGEFHAMSGENQEALDYYNQALAIARLAESPPEEATTLVKIGQVYAALGENRRALDYFNQALLLQRARGDKAKEGWTLDNIGSIYEVTGEEQKALEYLNQALKLQREIGDHSGEATTLRHIAWVYFGLGEMDKVLEYDAQALQFKEADADQSGQASTLNDMGLIYRQKGDKQKALVYYNQSLELRRAAGDLAGEGITLRNIGHVYGDTGEKQKALTYCFEALGLERAAGSRRWEAVVLNSIGYLYSSAGETQKALDYYNQAFLIERALGNRAGEASTLFNQEILFRHSQPDLAIAFGKQAINVLQSIRKDNQGLEDSLRASYERSIERYYRFLANLLIERDRFGEAEEVLNLLKDKEAKDFIRRDSISDQLHAATLLDSETAALNRYDQIVNQIVLLGQAKTSLDEKRKLQTPLTNAEVAQEAKLDQDLRAANVVLLRFLEEEQKSFAIDSAKAQRVEEFREAEGLQDVLQKLGPDVVAIYTLVDPNKYIALLVTSGARKAYISPIKEEDLNKKIFDLRRKLQDPGSDPIPLAQDMYHIVFPESLRKDLDALHAKTIMWSVDSTLRYIPFAALYDGKDYLVKSFRQSLITPASIPYLTEEPVRQWTGVGFGVSEGDYPLPSVPLELQGIFRDAANSHAPIPGPIRLNSAFTRRSFEDDLLQKENPVVHIATHFVSRPGVAANSYLLLGDGELSLAEIESESQLFRGVNLLTLSACNTAFTNRSEDGREVDSLGTIAQRLGARGVIASLWSVNDDSTAGLMEAMYQLHQQGTGMTKGEALRQAQVGLLAGNQQPTSNHVSQPSDPSASSLNGQPTVPDWSHPFYWAPFILLGNWK